jgi:hypothetical protein
MSDLISLIGGTTTGTIEAISGSLMYQDAMKNLDELRGNRPTYQTPAEVQQMVNLYAKEFQGAYKPLAWEDAAFGRQREATAAGVSASREVAGSGTDLQANVASLYGSERRALADIEIEAARQKEQRRQMYSQLYGQALGTQAQYKDKAWNWNEALKYQEDYNRLMGLAETGYETWQMGAETISASFDAAGQMDWESMASGGGSGGSTGGASDINMNTI